MSMTVVKKIELVDLECGECQFVFAVPRSWLDDKQQTGELFSCPIGHRISYAENENKRLQKEIERLKAQLTHAVDQQWAAEKEAEAVRRESNRQHKRVANGVCPCCNRTFVNLGRHMRGQHPAYAKTTPEVKR